MAQLIYNPAIECLPLDELAALSLENWRASGVMERASYSPLYREAWAAAGIDAAAIQSYDDLQRVPFTGGHAVREAQAQYSPEALVCGGPARRWVSTSGTTGKPKWVPVSDADILAGGEPLRRGMALVLGVVDDWTYLAFVSPAPYLTEPAAYDILMDRIADNRHAELTFVGLPETFDALTFARNAHIEGIFAFPTLAMVVAEGVSARAAEGALELYRQHKTVKNLLAALATRVIKIKARHLFKLRWALFGGEPVGPYRSALKDAFGLEPFSLYGATEFGGRPAVAECSVQQGMHLYMDMCLPEIIPQAELEREEIEPGYTPRAIPLWEADGQIGEFVITTFSEAFPLIRYRMSDLMEVVSTAPCACGRTHPRVLVHHRSDDIVNMGLIRFSVFNLKEAVEAAGGGVVQRWQLRVTREGYKPKARLLVQAPAAHDRQALAAEIRAAFDEIEGVKQAVTHGMIADPEVVIVDEVVEERTGTGKVRLAIYEDSYSQEA